ncbi:FAD-binding oxidoreductase [Breoghania sp.]|uniref:FAD-binding oxidoreductase n=1 Tax=Breoghania sp. TaxID=2065378 RepID=UPI002AA75539|nr:FAD-binding oxidoreductase [Breoghania sp.]
MSWFQARSDVKSWGGVLRAAHHVAGPQWRDEVGSVLDEARERKLTVLASGARRSYGDSGLNPGGALVDITGLDRILAFDPETGIVRAEGGVTFDTMIGRFLPRGFFLPVTPGTRFVTLAGVIANDVHGKNHHGNGTLGRWVRAIGLITSDGTLHELSPQREPELFNATIGGLGLTGVIVWAELQLMPVSSASMDAETVSFSNLDGFFDLAAESENGFDYTVAWVDCLADGDALGRGTFSRANHAQAGALDEDAGRNGRRFGVPLDFPGFVLNQHTVRAFNRVCYSNGRRKAGLAQVPLSPFFYPLDAIENWNRMYGVRGMYQYQSVIPVAAQREATRAMLEVISQSGQGSFLAVLKTFGTLKSPGMLSFPQEGTTLALDFPNRGGETLKLLARLDSIVAEAGGRLYPAKDGRMSAAMFRAGYPDWERFAVHVDPHFSSHFWRRVAG